MTPKPQGNKTIDKILDDFFQTMSVAEIDGGLHVRMSHNDLGTAKQQLLAEVLDMIGEDEKLRPNHSKMSQITHQIETRNFLKMQYRKAAKERFK